MSKLICMGECLIDFLPSGNQELDFIGKAGGAPTNVCACVGKLGGDAYYLGAMAKDNFGKFLFNKIKSYNVKTDYITFTDKAGTGLAFVSLDENGDRSFTFFRSPCADLLFDPENVKEEMFEKGDVLHFCSVDLVDSPTKLAHEKAIKIAREKGVYVSFDVNLRLNIWGDTPKCLSVVKEFLQYADIVKVTDEELELLTGQKDINQGLNVLFKIAKHALLVFVTLGADGSMVSDNHKTFTQKAYKNMVIDTTGAGDCFSGVIIYGLLNRVDKNMATLTIEEMLPQMELASKACSIVVSKKGAMESMPTQEELKDFEVNNGKN